MPIANLLPLIGFFDFLLMCGVSARKSILRKCRCYTAHTRFNQLCLNKEKIRDVRAKQPLCDIKYLRVECALKHLQFLILNIEK